MYLRHILFFWFVAIPLTASAQWTNRYPRIAGYSHHVYVEGFELPTLTSGPMDPAPAPDSVRVAFASRGWIWIFNPETGIARRATSGRDMDSRPAWSPDGTRIAFVRDTGSDTRIVMLDLESGDERVVVDRHAMELDPAFSKDGKYLYYSSAIEGNFDLWRQDLATGQHQLVTNYQGFERSPKPGRDEDTWLYLEKSFGGDNIVLLEMEPDSTGQPLPERNRSSYLASDWITSQASFTVSPDGRALAYTWPQDDGYELRMLSVYHPTSSLLLTKGDGLPLTPAWSADGEWIWFAEGTEDESTALRRISANGGSVETIEVTSWDWGEEVGRVRIRTTMNGEPVATRLNVLDGSGHPAVPSTGSIRFDGRNGRVFFYSPGELEIEVPAGDIQISAVHGLLTREKVERISVKANDITEVELDLEAVWNPREAGWYASDHHFHLNYGGPYDLDPQDIMLDLRAEAMDVATPLLANLHNRFLDQDLWSWRDTDGELPFLAFGQEIRSHFLGHISLIGTESLHWPWVWGPGYQLYDKDDRTNGAVLDFANAQGGLGGYVHPVSGQDPFGANGFGIPLNLIADAVHGKLGHIEVGCLWTSAVGTAEVWHRLLNLGIPVSASAGTDVMNNFYRTMAIGTTRLYVKMDEPFEYGSYLEAFKAGRSFVTNGPMLEFTIDGVEPGGVVEAGKEVSWSLDVHSAVPYDTVEVFLNGAVVWESGIKDSYEGKLTTPVGGWISVRVRGEGYHQWPMMDRAVFAQTSPIWIGEVGSIEPNAATKSVAELMNALEVAESRIAIGYAGAEIPRLRAYLKQAKELLSNWVK